MVGRTKLIRTTGSPLIGGLTKRGTSRRVVWVIAALIALAAVAAAVWYLFIR